MVSLTEQDGALVAVLDVDDETADRISKGLILGAAAVLDPLANTLTGVQVTNRPGCTGLRGYDIAASYSEDAGLVMLTATSFEEPFRMDETAETHSRAHAGWPCLPAQCCFPLTGN